MGKNNMPKYIRRCLQEVKKHPFALNDMERSLKSNLKDVFECGTNSIKSSVYDLDTIPWPIFVNYCFHATKSDILTMIKYLRE